MSNCGKGCGRGCCDFSSREQRSPNIASIDVVEGLLFKALTNMRGRHEALRAGDMAPEDLEAADGRLVDWLAATFSGRNPHFESVEEWNPYGLAQLIREKADMPELHALDDEAVVRTACEWFAAAGRDAVQRDSSDEALRAVASRWAEGFAGVPEF